jgi:RNA-directed DNA polymerase
VVRLHLHRPTPDRSLKTKIRASTHRASQQDLAEVLIRLGQIMHGWANYFRYAIAKNTFSTLDSFVWWGRWCGSAATVSRL